jgi:predicted alpha-1,2-mannosidase
MHDPLGLADLMGGQKIFLQMLDSVFNMPPAFDYKNYGKVIHEMREMQTIGFGQYAHGNEPIQHMIYLYDWAGEPWKTQYWSRQVMERLYQPTSDGYCGDEDNGQTSAWYVFSALGIYPVCPATGELAIGSPLFRKVILTLPDGKSLRLNAALNSEKNVYIKEITLNGKVFTKNYFTLEQLQKGGEVNFQMSPDPNTKRGIRAADFPYSLSGEKLAD